MESADADGIRIAYEDSGRGEPALLCLTGWCSSKERYEHLVPLLARNRRTIAFDWRGHGDSQRDVGDFGVEEMVQDALAVIHETAVAQIVPVAASHSGWVAIEVRRRLGPDRVPRIVHMDWMVVEPSERYMDVIELLQSPETWPQARDTLFTIWRAGVQTSEIDRVIGVMRAHDADMWMRSGREIEAAYRQGGGSPLATYMDLAPEPTHVLHLYGQPQDPGYLEVQRTFAKSHPWFSVQHVHAQSHFAMIETAEEAAAAIEAFVAER
jgi:pimeloyl-ACP methyl ester carboxylesterase